MPNMTTLTNCNNTSKMQGFQQKSNHFPIQVQRGQTTFAPYRRRLYAEKFEFAEKWQIKRFKAACIPHTYRGEVRCSQTFPVHFDEFGPTTVPYTASRRRLDAMALQHIFNCRFGETAIKLFQFPDDSITGPSGIFVCELNNEFFERLV